MASFPRTLRYPSRARRDRQAWVPVVAYVREPFDPTFARPLHDNASGRTMNMFSFMHQYSITLLFDPAWEAARSIKKLISLSDFSVQ